MSSSAPNITWARGGQAHLVAFDGERLTVLSSVSAAPGTPLRGKLTLPPQPASEQPASEQPASEQPASEQPTELPVELKVHGCKRTPDGRFTLSGRVVSLTRELRAALQSLLSPPPPAL